MALFSFGSETNLVPYELFQSAVKKITCCLCFGTIFQNSYAGWDNCTKTKTKVNKLFFYYYTRLVREQIGL